MAESQAQPSLPSASPIGRFFGLFRRWPIVSLALIAILAFVAIFSPWISPQSPIKNSVRDRNAPPFWYTEWYEENPKAARTYILGADPIGRDVLSRLIHGARISSIVVVVALVSGTVVGTALGLVAGYAGGITDEVITRVVDIWLGLPFILLALIVAITIGPGLLTMMGLLAATAWTPFVRNVRAEVLTLRERDYVQLARVAGASPLRILWKHILPGVLNTVLGNRHASHRAANPDRIVPKLPRRRHPAAHAHLGRDDSRRQRVSARRLVGIRIRRRSHRPDCLGPKLLRRLDAGHLRPAACGRCRGNPCGCPPPHPQTKTGAHKGRPCDSPCRNRYNSRSLM